MGPVLYAEILSWNFSQKYQRILKFFGSRDCLILCVNGVQHSGARSWQRPLGATAIHVITSNYTFKTWCREIHCVNSVESLPNLWFRGAPPSAFKGGNEIFPREEVFWPFRGLCVSATKEEQEPGHLGSVPQFGYLAFGNSTNYSGWQLPNCHNDSFLSHSRVGMVEREANSSCIDDYRVL